MRCWRSCRPCSTDRMYAEVGRPSIPPERLLKATLLIGLYSVRSERAFCEQLAYNFLFRWFLGMNSIDPVFDAVLFAADQRGLLSDEHFTVDGTLIQAAASLKSFKPKDGDPGNPWMDFHGEKRGNATHQSMTDPEALLAKKSKGTEAKLSFLAHALMENHNGLLMDFQVSQATGTAERDAVPTLLDDARARGFHPKTLGGDKNYDTRDCVRDLRQRGVTPHVARNTSGRRSAIDGRTTRHPGYVLSQRIRKRVDLRDLWLDEDRGRLPTHPLPRTG